MELSDDMLDAVVGGSAWNWIIVKNRNIMMVML